MQLGEFRRFLVDIRNRLVEIFGVILIRQLRVEINRFIQLLDHPAVIEDQTIFLAVE